MNGPVRTSNARYVVFLAMIAAMPALATDMYLAAIPTIAAQWGQTTDRVGLSLVLWFVAFSVSLLICGPLSDKHGRRPILLAGLALFVAASFACSLAMNVWQLIALRVLQGMGASGPSSMVMAISRDRYDGIQRKRALAYIGIVMAVIPAVSPVIGALLLRFITWRAIFLTQGVLAAVTLWVSLGYVETAPERLAGGLLQLMGRYGRLIANRRYSLSTVAMGLIAGPFFGFIGFSSIVYISIFGLSAQMFGVLFGLNALTAMCGSFTCTRVMRRLSDKTLLSICLIGCTAAGAALLVLGGRHYLAFAGSMGVFTFFCGMSRPLSNNLILQQVDHDIGSAASFIVFYQFLVAAICMKLVTIPWSMPIAAFGLMALSLPALVLAIWPFLIRMLGRSITSDTHL
jgi:DHA1 family bicyclomycin/chloramphenicol resistance-like MFS transporter